jgi:UDPglucose 6-dehydrogenase
MREAPARVLMEALWEAGARVRALRPGRDADEARRIYGSRPDLTLREQWLTAIAGADALAIVTEWQEFRSPISTGMKAALKSPAIFDGRNLYDPP